MIVGKVRYVIIFSFGGFIVVSELNQVLQAATSFDDYFVFDFSQSVELWFIIGNKDILRKLFP